MGGSKGFINDHTAPPKKKILNYNPQEYRHENHYHLADRIIDKRHNAVITGSGRPYRRVRRYELTAA